MALFLILFFTYIIFFCYIHFLCYIEGCVVQLTELHSLWLSARVIQHVTAILTASTKTVNRYYGMGKKAISNPLRASYMSLHSGLTVAVSLMSHIYLPLLYMQSIQLI